MKKFIKILVVLLFFYSGIKAQEKLCFDKNGEFKIVQFTDTHVNIEKGENLDIFKYLQKIIKIEKPNLAIITGDVVSSDAPEKMYKFFVDVFEKEKLPWAVTFGNHDSRDSTSREDIAELLQSLPYCLNQHDDGGVTGSSNFVLPVRGKSNKPAALLYCMDSNSYSTLKPRVDGYGWFDRSQIDWYIRESKKFNHENGREPLPALAFFHIPLPEYVLAWNDKNAARFGRKREKVCCPDINTGMFAAMVEFGDVMGTFVGHDHYNDYIVNYYGIALAYGRATKIRNQKRPALGGRIIVLKEGKREFDTWIRQLDGEKVFPCTWPGSFKK